MFVWTLEYSEDAERDFELIFDHLFDAYVELGDAPDRRWSVLLNGSANCMSRSIVSSIRPISGCAPIFIPGFGFYGGTRRLFGFYRWNIAAQSLSRQFSTARRTTSEYARTYAGGVRFLQPRGPRQIDPKSVASAVVAAVLHVALVDFGRGGQAGAQRMTGEFGCPHAFAEVAMQARGKDRGDSSPQGVDCGCRLSLRTKCVMSVYAGIS